MQTEHKLYLWKGTGLNQNIAQNNVNDHLLNICFHKSISFCSVACSRHSDSRRPGTGYLLWNIIKKLSQSWTLYLTERLTRFKFQYKWLWIGTTLQYLCLKKSRWPKYCTDNDDERRNNGDKKGVNHSNNKERCSAGNLDESVGNQGIQTLALHMFIETSGECVSHWKQKWSYTV